MYSFENKPFLLLSLSQLLGVCIEFEGLKSEILEILALIFPTEFDFEMANADFEFATELNSEFGEYRIHRIHFFRTKVTAGILGKKNTHEMHLFRKINKTTQCKQSHSRIWSRKEPRKPKLDQK